VVYTTSYLDPHFSYSFYLPSSLLESYPQRIPTTGNPGPCEQLSPRLPPPINWTNPGFWRWTNRISSELLVYTSYFDMYHHPYMTHGTTCVLTCGPIHVIGLHLQLRINGLSRLWGFSVLGELTVWVLSQGHPHRGISP
jgi:hypothetical protein